MKALITAALLVMLGACGTGGADTTVQPPPPPMSDDPIVCAADVKQCPDSTYVSRNPANGCAFDLCPGASNQ